MKKLTTEDFIAKAREVHDDKYDYSKVEYINRETKVCIICPEHGEFEQFPHHHLRGHGCNQCSVERNRRIKTSNSEDFVKKAKKIHGDRYDYSKVNYINSNTKITIICKKCGKELEIEPNSHLSQKSGCRCYITYNTYDTSQWITKAKEVHSDKYDYSKTKYIDWNTKVCIICPEHGEFWKMPSQHIQGQGCPKCQKKNDTINKRKINLDKFISKSQKKFGNRYDYSKVEYKGVNVDVCIICPEHGEVWMKPSVHLSNRIGCVKCARQVNDTESFIEKSIKIHGNKYDYRNVKYINARTEVCIICPEHGEFWQLPFIHSNGSGCPKCHGRNKTTEDFITDAREIHGDKYDYSKVEYVNGKQEVCIICPEHGEFWQIPKLHLNGAGCPICNLGFVREYKLSLLECDDLIHMSSHQLIEIIANKKLPTEFKSLAYTHPDSESRVGAIRDLIDLFSDDNKTDDEIENEASEQVQNRENELSSNPELNDEFNLVLGDSEGVSENNETEPSLPSMVIGNAHAFDDLVHMKPSDEAAKFLVLEETHRIWNGVLRANEEGKLDEVIEKIKTEDGGEFWKYIQTTFLNEFNEVVSIEKGADYKFPYDPSLMQKLMVYYLTNNKSFGNWCGTGAGKTNAFLFATRKTNSRVTVAIVPNDVIDTLVKSINKIYPDSVVVVPQSSDELFTCDRSKFTYIIYNYEKFQGNNGAEDTVNRLLETNTIDFICLDEVQNVKVRDIETASSRSQFINSLVLRGRIANPEMRTLAMSATPCINNLTEVRSIIELLTGVEHSEIGNRNTIANIHNAYKALLINGFRYIPKYPIVIEERTVEVDCSEDAELYLDLTNKEKGDISGIEYVLAEKKLNSVKDELKPGTIVYATWVDGMAELLTKNIRKWGYSVESYNGESGNKDGRKEILDRFLSGKTDVLVCSKPISTGVDGLQYKCNKMIIVSLPWTDADYTQLKGRIYRQGSVFNRVEFVIPQIVINTPSGVVWSWDKMRKHAIDTKKSLGSAVVDGYIQKTYTINKEKLLSKAMEALKEGLIDIETERTPIATEITYIMKEREYSESFINNVHSLANRSSSKTTHTRYVNNPDEFKEYHRQREISKESWVEDPVDRVADIINSWSNRYTRIIDMGCGMNKLKTVVNTNKTVQGVDHINVSPDATVIEADMSNLNGIVDDNSKDVAVFCLSLWGVNYKDYFTEAYRILDADGRMIIVEPSSKFGTDKHFSTIDEFVDDVENYGFERTGKVETHNNFVYLKFTKI